MLKKSFSWSPKAEKKVSQCCFKNRTTGEKRGFPVLLWGKNNTTGGGKGLPVELRLRVPRRIKRSPSAASGQKQNHARRKQKQCCFGTKTEPQEEKHVSQSSFKELRLGVPRRRRKFPSAALGRKQNHRRRNRFPSGVKA